MPNCTTCSSILFCHSCDFDHILDIDNTGCISIDDDDFTTVKNWMNLDCTQSLSIRDRVRICWHTFPRGPRCMLASENHIMLLGSRNCSITPTNKGRRRYTLSSSINRLEVHLSTWASITIVGEEEIRDRTRGQPM